MADNAWWQCEQPEEASPEVRQATAVQMVAGIPVRRGDGPVASAWQMEYLAKTTWDSKIVRQIEEIYGPLETACLGPAIWAAAQRRNTEWVREILRVQPKAADCALSGVPEPMREENQAAMITLMRAGIQPPRDGVAKATLWLAQDLAERKLTPPLAEKPVM